MFITIGVYISLQGKITNSKKSTQQLLRRYTIIRLYCYLKSIKDENSFYGGRTITYKLRLLISEKLSNPLTDEKFFKNKYYTHIHFKIYLENVPVLINKDKLYGDVI